MTNPVIFRTFDDIGYVLRDESAAHGDFVTRDERLDVGTFVTLPTEAEVGSHNWFRQQTGQADGCVICGGSLPTRTNAYGRTAPWGGRRTCSNACRQKAYRLRRRASP